MWFSSSARGICLVLLVPGVATAPLALPHRQEQNAPAPYKLKVNVDVVNVEVIVTDSRGGFVEGLKQEDFRVLDNGAEQPLTNFAPVKSPAQVLVLIETGPAVYLLHREHLGAAYALLEGLAADDRIALGSYDQFARLTMNFTTDKNALAGAIGALHYSLGMAQLNLFDSLSATLDWLALLPGKKAIVLLSTGLDTSGPGHFQALLEKLRASDVVVLPVALGGELRGPADKPAKKSSKREKGSDAKSPPLPRAGDAGNLSFEEADRALEAIAEATGGHAYFPRGAAEFGGVYLLIAATLRHQYSLGFKLPARDARFHKLEVQVVDSPGDVPTRSESRVQAARATPAIRSAYRIHFRPGYLAPAP